MALARKEYHHRHRKQIKRKGVHAKSKTSRLKGSKIYAKPYRGQGR